MNQSDIPWAEVVHVEYENDQAPDLHYADPVPLPLLPIVVSVVIILALMV